MAYKLWYFAHVGGLSIWLGALISGLWLTVSALRTDGVESRVWGLGMSVRMAGGIGTAAALTTAGAGIMMMVAGGMMGLTKPLWFKVMEMGGGTLALVSVMALLLFGRPLQRQLRALESPGAWSAELRRKGSRFALSAGTMAVLVLGVLLTVSLRLG